MDAMKQNKQQVMSMAEAARAWAKGSLPGWLTPILLGITVWFASRLVTDHEERIKNTELAVTLARERIVVIETKIDQIQNVQRETLGEVKLLNATLRK